MPVTKLVANLEIRSRWFISGTRFGEQAAIPNARFGYTKAPYNPRPRSKAGDSNEGRSLILMHSKVMDRNKTPRKMNMSAVAGCLLRSNVLFGR